MPDSRPPRVRVTLPGDVPGTLHDWRQDEHGDWWGRVEVWAPADAVQQVDGEDYSSVPREPATPPEATSNQYVLVAANASPDQPRAAELHRADCWAISRVKTHRVAPVGNVAQARAALRFPDTTPCDICQPEP